jgi:hypothetical protein
MNPYTKRVLRLGESARGGKDPSLPAAGRDSRVRVKKQIFQWGHF